MATAKDDGDDKGKARPETTDETKPARAEQAEAEASAGPAPAPDGMTIVTDQPGPAFDARGQPNTGPGHTAGDMIAEADRLEARAKELRRDAKKTA